ncbi:MAG: YegS/Rv2252/BmrU family lipid kinase [Clostridiales Family XIII bacterium]|jgi:YegS/Rv2252/BmrU family lipid kinase|nr:YegS/Rv2252/BmrU family lipid kinase [Clostridiales Family XIII bacterium]
MAQRKKVLLFYNPNAGNGVFSNNLDAVVAAFQKKKFFLVPLRADRSSILDDFFRQADFSSYHKIIAAGGDGTINAVVSAMVKYDVHLPLAIFPAGTANDLAHYFDLPDRIDDMLRIATNERYTDMDVGLVNGRCFVNVLAMGMLVDVSQKTDPSVKNTLGVMAYYLRGLAEVPKLKPIPVKITCPDRVVEEKMYAMLVMNGRSAGGFRRAAPNAVINDGLFDVVLFKGVPVMNLAATMLSVLSGQHMDHKNVVFFRTPKLHIESPVEFGTDVDGETGDKLPLDIEILPSRLKINTLENDMEGLFW